MPGAPRPETAGEWLADGLAAHLRDWATAGGAPADALPILAAAGRLACLATQAGHVCAHIDDLTAHFPHLPPAHLRERLLASGLVSSVTDAAAGKIQPLLLDDDGRLYLYRYYAYERRLADNLRRRAGRSATTADATIGDRLAQLFAANRARLGERVDWQRLAVALAWRNRLTIISGGPGTGKTRSIAALLACLLDEQPDRRVALAAPTGKAAARMLEALRHSAATLPMTLQQRLPREAYTVHRLLGASDAPGRFRHHADNLLPIDTLIVDEASMLDLALACQLFDAVPMQARVILLGDKDQLSAVEAGAVFAELSADPTLSAACVADLAALSGTPPAAIIPPPPLHPTPLADSVLWLNESHRFSQNSGIGRLAAEINAGHGAAACDWLARADDASLRWLEDHVPTGSDRLPAALRQAMLDAYAPYFDAVVERLRLAENDAADGERAIFAAFDRFRVLCALRAGARGVVAVNRWLENQLHQRLARAAPSSLSDAPSPHSPWYPGRPVMVLRNDPLQRLFNGDVGLCLPDENGELSVCFPAADGRFRRIAPARLPEHETAFAITVHKSQGSEFASLLLLLPEAGQGESLLTRELLYTGITRAAQQVSIAASRQVLIDACAKRSLRRSGLLARLRSQGNAE